MPFDVRDCPAGNAAAARDRRLLALWLLALSAMVFVMVVLGGATRLSGSGLSIMEWAPLAGALPPMSDAEWQRLFALYRQIPQYELLHAGFGLAGFKQIFWLEWIHRFWGRLIGLAFLIPLIWLWARGAIPRSLRPRLVLLFVLGGLQGAVGWFMVKSGFFPDSIAVSAYRLVAHLAFALLLYLALLWTGLSVLRGTRPREGGASWRSAALAVALVALTILAGGFVAGLHAGRVYNTFPLMDGHLVPRGYAELAPFWRNLVENVVAVQFDHRVLATLSAVAVGIAVLRGLRMRPRGLLRAALMAFGGLVAVQYALGVTTLLAAAPPGLATLHQAVAMLLLTAGVVTLHAARVGAASNPPEDPP
jgi:cytochrome c oxidase assembly protein subunit 15